MTPGITVQKELAAYGHKALAVPTDVSSEDSVNGMVSRCLTEFGRVDILVNNAGIFPHSAVEEMTDEEWDRVIGTNLVGCFLCARALVPIFIKERQGRIISVASGLGLKGMSDGAHYAASKAGIIGFTAHPKRFHSGLASLSCRGSSRHQISGQGAGAHSFPRRSMENDGRRNRRLVL